MNRLETSLFTVGLRVFEELAFMLPYPVLDEEQACAKPEAAVTVEFSGPMNGMLLLTLSGQLLSALAANMLGEDSPPTELDKNDALKEIANVICGNLLPHIGGPAAVLDISPPQVRELQSLKGEISDDPVVHQSIGFEGGRADLQLFLWGGSLLQES